MITIVGLAYLLGIQANRKLAIYLKCAVELATIFKRIYQPEKCHCAQND